MDGVGADLDGIRDSRTGVPGVVQTQYLGCDHKPACLHSVLIARIALPLPIERLWSYRVPGHLTHNVAPGSCVTVPFGRRSLVGVVVEEGTEADLEGVDARQIESVSLAGDDASGGAEITPELLELTRWMATYYMCSWGEALRAALPPGAGRPGEAAPTRVRVTRVALAKAPPRAEPRGERQQALLHELRQRRAKDMDNPTQPELLEKCGGSSTTIRRLEELGYVRTYTTLVDRYEYAVQHTERRAERMEETLAPRIALNESQQRAVEALNGAVESNAFSTFLLHGVTGSGKTEVYLNVLERVRSRGRTGIVLVPEIALTPQTVRRFRRRFGDEVAVLHSRMSQGERYDAWQGIRSGKYTIVVGARSAILAPVPNPGLIIVDEEHEASYKQFDPAPRYHARDVAVVRARQAGAVCVLGSATPSLESLANALSGKYTLLPMPDRVPVNGRPAEMPDIQIVDQRGSSEFVSTRLVDALKDCLRRQEQGIVLLNRRGYAPTVECTSCGWTPECPDCSVGLVYHKPLRHLRCHHCGLVNDMPRVCPSCRKDTLEKLGTGTQRLEESIQEALPEARILRMDLDTTSGKNAHHDILEAFGSGKADILLGTQMVAKGLDFPRVTVVGIVQADAALSLPDIRAEERTFQLITQVAGRAGRHDLRGQVLLQTRKPGHLVIQHARRHDYDAFAQHALAERQALGYPPHGRIIRALFSGPDDDRTESMARLWALRLAERAAQADVLGPSPAFIHRVRRSWRHQVLVKLPPGHAATSLRKALDAATAALGRLPRGYRMSLDVDPVGMV